MFSSFYIVCSLCSAYYRPFSDFPQRMGRGGPAQLPVLLGRSRIYHRHFLRYDGSIPGPFPLICPSQRILNSCFALIKYRRVQTSLHRIIICSERRLPECPLFIICAYPHHTQPAEPDGAKSVHAPSVPHMTDSKAAYAPSVPRYRSKWQDHVGTSALRCRPLASYVPLCSDLSGSASCTAACIAGRQLHTQSLPTSRNGSRAPSHFLYRGTAIIPPRKKGEAPEGPSPLA